MNAAGGTLRDALRRPDPGHGPIPFWWWVGDTLDRERLVWQLDRLRERGVRHAVVSYNHLADGGSNPGDPAVFSAAWWELFRWLLGQCRERGMFLGFQDYTLSGPALAGIAARTPDMAGGQVRECHATVAGGGSGRLAVPAGTRALVAWALPLVDGRPSLEGALDLTERIRDGVLAWEAAAGAWLLSLAWVETTGFDPLHPGAGELACAALYEPFVSACPGAVGTVMPVFFQDELDFGNRMPMWSVHLPAAFAALAGEDLLPCLPALWHDVGPRTSRIRILFADAVTRRLEEAYFAPVFRWHERHGTILGHDNCGRGRIALGCGVYGDYFRTMRWYHAPGCDDPDLRRPRAFRGLKIASSIAHLYRRPRVWCEAFHSSGWGVTPAQIIAGLNEDFVYGMTVVNLHGLYYSTHGSYWEWAPPDVHFRQPYWVHCAPLNAYATRLCALLSRGTHVCDVAILYPVTAIEGGLNPRRRGDGDGSLSDIQAGHDGELVDAAEDLTFAIGRRLVADAVDVDYIDFESLERAVCRDGRLEVAGESYRVLVLPHCTAVRFSTLRVAAAFRRCGGQVVAVGALPRASERLGADDDLLEALVAELFPAGPLPDDAAAAARTIAALVPRDVTPLDAPLLALHRRDGDQDLYFLWNPQDRAVRTRVRLRAVAAGRQVERWDAWSGGATPLPWQGEDGTGISLELAAHEAALVVFTADGAAPAGAPRSAPVTTLGVDGRWTFTPVPVLDNRHGDFRLPAGGGCLGPELRRLRHAEETGDAAAWPETGFDDTAWPETAVSYGPRFWSLGPFPPGTDLAALEAELGVCAAIDPGRPVVVAGDTYPWRPRELSLRWGIEDDPVQRDWASGPHGLKGEVAEDVIDLHDPRPGALWLVWTSLHLDEAGVHPLVAGSRSAFVLRLDGRVVLRQERALPPGTRSPWHLPHHDGPLQEARITATAGHHPLLLRLEQSAGQRTRIRFACAPPPADGTLALRWFRGAPGWRFDARPHRPARAWWYRALAPAGLTGLDFTARGPVRVWVDGRERSCTVAAGVVRCAWKEPLPHRAVVALRIEPPAGSFAGDPLPEPLRLVCGSAEVVCGDWSELGLGCYSGLGRYERRITLSAEQAAGRVELDLGRVTASARVLLNGDEVGMVLVPPWRVELTGHVRAGPNHLVIEVANTLASHLGVGIPTPYVFPGQTAAGFTGRP